MAVEDCRCQVMVSEIKKRLRKHGNKDESSETLKLAKILIAEREDLIHKAVGCMLREVGKRNVQIEEQFLKWFQNPI